jgi:hypothetical protein
MRRTLGLIAVAVGAFLLVAAPLVKWYLAPRATKVPLDQYSVSESVSDGKSVVLDKGNLKIRSGLTLTNRQVVQGDSEAGNGTTAVWDSLVKLADSDGTMVDASSERVAFDRVSGLAVDCCGQAYNGVELRHEGLSFKFPFDTERITYPFFDPDTRKAWPMEYQGEESLFGLTLYHFQQKIPATDVETLGAPLSLLGQPGEGSISVRRYYENVTDVLVEPATGIIVKGGQHQVQTLRDAAGTPYVTVADVNATYTEATQRSYADDAKAAISQLTLVRTILPAGAAAGGLLLIVLGLVLVGTISRPVRASTAAPLEPQRTGTSR